MNCTSLVQIPTNLFNLDLQFVCLHGDNFLMVQHEQFRTGADHVIICKRDILNSHDPHRAFVDLVFTVLAYLL
jgi:hypothetical protein